ncbi:hypothetical protein FGO68_gene8722 [Halteria grandinella]|uniref:Ubiquitin-like domain-containing protein n=1 Tax=Halteria grandinella TaxID=5974 RepID=A0A8J8NMX6_HALGN|nr:hypothetical protein FGO68_gene8722 [Halteria grandinella]
MGDFNVKLKYYVDSVLNQKEFPATGKMTVCELKRQISKKLKTSYYNLQHMTFLGQILDDEEEIWSYEIEEGSVLEFSYQVHDIDMDIGNFDQNHEGKVGCEILKGSVKVGDFATIVQSLKGNPSAQFNLVEPGLISNETIIRLKQLVDREHLEFSQSWGTERAGELDDFKYNLIRKELSNLIGQKTLQKLEALYEDTYDEIVIRRCQSHGQFINFHTDFSKRTLQVALNGDDEYEGGRLVYVTGGVMHTPQRPTGSITIHQNDIVHGVSKLGKGVRYGLFLLKKK